MPVVAVIIPLRRPEEWPRAIGVAAGLHQAFGIPWQNHQIIK